MGNNLKLAVGLSALLNLEACGGAPQKWEGTCTPIAPEVSYINAAVLGEVLEDLGVEHVGIQQDFSYVNCARITDWWNVDEQRLDIESKLSADGLQASCTAQYGRLNCLGGSREARGTMDDGSELMCFISKATGPGGKM